MKVRSLMLTIMLIQLAQLGVSIGSAEEIITVYTYHNHPPFVTGDFSGLSFEFVEQLNQANDQFMFKLKIVPRRRLNNILRDWIAGKCLGEENQCERAWIVLWVNQLWGFGREPDRYFHWIPLLDDSNAIISLTQNPVNYTGPDALVGKRFGAIGGHRYVGIDDLVKVGKINRVDGNDERGNVIMLIQNRVDAILLPTSTIRYFLEKDSWISRHASTIYVSPEKHQHYKRNLMVPRGHRELIQLVSRFDTRSRLWIEALNNAGFTPSQGP